MDDDVLRAGRPQDGMVDRGPGRTDRAEPGERRGEPLTLAEPHDREVRQPGPRLRLVDPEAREALVHLAGEPGGGTVLVAEDDHPAAPGLAVAELVQDDRPRAPGRGGQLPGDRVPLGRRPRAETRHRDMEARPPNHPVPARGKRFLPRHQPVDRLPGKRERAEEPLRAISGDATSRIHTRMSRSRARRRRPRWSAATVARSRTVSRSAGKPNSSPRPPSGLSAWRYTRPTGLSGVPPSGPAMPVTDTPTSTPRRARTPAAISAAASADTAP